MPNPLNVPITPPRVAFIDSRTGNISREWYMFFLSLFSLTNGSNLSLVDLQKGPPVLTIDEANAIVNKAAENLRPSTEGVIEQIAELRKKIEALESLVRPELGSLSALQQDNVPWLQFDTTPAGMPTGATAHGALYWDNANRSKTLALVMEDSGNVIQDIGEETFYRVKATSNITKGQVVMFNGTVGASGGLLGAPATGLTATQSEQVMGIATQDIATNSWGYVTWFGEVDKVNTTGGAEAWVDGQVLYYNPAVAGGLTKNVPSAPNPKVIVASVVHAGTNGILFVRPTFGSALGATDSNVEISGLADGDLLQYDSTQQRWENVPATNSLGSATNGQLLIGNGTGFTKATLTAGTNITITNGAGSITVAAVAPFGTSTASGTNLATFSGTLPTGSAASTNTWTKITISGADYWLPIWAV